MGGAPGLYPGDVHGAAKVVPVLRARQPRGLAGGLAGTAALGFAAVALALAVARVGQEKLPAAQALTLPCLGHRRCSSAPPQGAAQRGRPGTETQSEEDPCEGEEDPSETIERRRRIRKKMQLQIGQKKTNSGRR
jgi:hypothetical protein